MLAHLLQAQIHHHSVSNQLKLLSYTRVTLKYLSHRQPSGLLCLSSGAVESALGRPDYTLWGLSKVAMRPLKIKCWSELGACKKVRSGDLKSESPFGCIKVKGFAAD